MTEVAPLPAGSRLIHIGPQKTGSTALQGALHHARPQLRELGVLYPGPTARPMEAFAAGLGLAMPLGAPQPDIGLWHDLQRQLAEPGVRVACVSHEALGRCGPPIVKRVVEEIGGPRPHVLAVARSYERLLPSQWQQRVKARVSLSYEEWLRIVLLEGPYSPIRRNLWIAHDTARLVKRWAVSVGLENVTVVIASEQDRYLLLRTAEQLLGLPPDLLSLVESRSNRSLTYPEVELLRGLNEIFDRNQWSDEDYYDLVACGVIPALVNNEPHPDDAPIPDLPEWARERIVELSARRVRLLSQMGVRVVGDLESLLTPATPPTPPDAALDGSVFDPADHALALRALEGMVSGYFATASGKSRRARIQRRSERMRRQRTSPQQ
jgi:hypothetical protein